jgi:hypothetical protein
MIDDHPTFIQSLGMDDNTKPPTRREMIRRIEERAALADEFLARHSEEQLTGLRDGSGWSAKDHVAHLAAWAFGIADLLLKRPRWLAMGLEHAQWNSLEEQSINDMLFEADKNRPLGEVVTLFRAANSRLVFSIEQMEHDDDLFRSYTHYQPSDPATTEDPIWPRIVGNSFGHVEEHLGWIREWLP